MHQVFGKTAKFFRGKRTSFVILRNCYILPNQQNCWENPPQNIIDAHDPSFSIFKLKVNEEINFYVKNIRRVLLFGVKSCQLQGQRGTDDFRN